VRNIENATEKKSPLVSAILCEKYAALAIREHKFNHLKQGGKYDWTINLLFVLEITGLMKKYCSLK